MQSIDLARFRAATLKAVRSFFDERGYLEVDPPILAPELIPEAHIEVFATRLVSPYRARGTENSNAAPGDPTDARYLIPSPEVWMKQLLAAGYGNIYYLGKCFRNAESTSHMHRPEFTMLEWYTVDSDYSREADLTEALLAHLADRLPPAAGTGGVAAEPARMTVAESFQRYAGARPDFARTDGMREIARAAGLTVGVDETEEDLFQRVLLTFVEPRLPSDRPVFLTDYPALVPTLARRTGATAERWELYLAGMEIANCYSEERDRDELARFLEREADRKRTALVPHPAATSLLEFSQAPECSGGALGVDRLIMALTGLRDIGGVIFSS